MNTGSCQKRLRGSRSLEKVGFDLAMAGQFLLNV